MIAPFRGQVLDAGGLPTVEFQTWMQRVTTLAGATEGATATADRPTRNLWTGRVHFDTTLGKPVWYDGSGWVDATGASA